MDLKKNASGRKEKKLFERINFCMDYFLRGLIFVN